MAKSINPQIFWSISVKQKGETCFDSVSMFSFDDAIFFRCIWAGQVMHYTTIFKMFNKLCFDKFATAI